MELRRLSLEGGESLEREHLMAEVRKLQISAKYQEQLI
jgi:hypothetical protein